MKKSCICKTSIFLVCCFVFVLFSGCEKELMKDYVSENYYNYEFTVKNPLFYYMGIPDLDEVKGKIVKWSSNTFTLSDKGEAVYDDDGTVFDSKVNYTYFFFDSDGKITKAIKFLVFDNVYLGSKIESEYTYHPDSISVKAVAYPEQYDEYGMKEEDYREYSISADDDGYLSFYNNTLKKVDLKFKKGEVIVFNDAYVVECQYMNDAFIERYYDKSEEKKLLEVDEYLLGCPHKISYFLDGWKRVVEIKNNMRITSDYTDSTLTATTTDYFEQTFYPSGLKKSLKLYEGLNGEYSPGVHVYQKLEIIDKPDRWLREYDKQIQDINKKDKYIEKNTLELS